MSLASICQYDSDNEDSSDEIEAPSVVKSVVSLTTESPPLKPEIKVSSKVEISPKYETSAPIIIKEVPSHASISKSAVSSFDSAVAEKIPAESPIYQNNYSTPLPADYYFQASNPSSQEDSRRVNKKRRQLENELLNGNILLSDNDLQSSSVRVVDVQSNNWNSGSYIAQKQREEELKSIYNVNSMHAPTKVQNKRHQINSLVAAAANMEVQLLDATAKRKQTKRETQMKYGW